MSLEVRLFDGESQDSLLRRFQKKVQLEGIIREFKSKRYFMNKRDAARGKHDYEMDWKSTIERNFKKSICYYGKDEQDDEKTQIEMKKKFGEL